MRTVRLELNDDADRVFTEMQRINGCSPGQLIVRALALKRGVDNLFRQGFRKLACINESSKDVLVIEDYEP